MTIHTFEQVEWVPKLPNAEGPHDYPIQKASSASIPGSSRRWFMFAAIIVPMLHVADPGVLS